MTLLYSVIGYDVLLRDVIHRHTDGSHSTVGAASHCLIVCIGLHYADSVSQKMLSISFPLPDVF